MAKAILNLKVLGNKLLKDKLVFFDIVLSVSGRFSHRFATLYIVSHGPSYCLAKHNSGKYSPPAQAITHHNKSGELTHI